MGSFCKMRLAPFVAAVLLAMTSAPVAWADGAIEDVTINDFGTFGRVPYVQIVGRLRGMTNSGPYDVPLEIVTPADPAKGNGVVLFEVLHPSEIAFGRDFALGGDFLFRRGFSWAAVRSFPPNFGGPWPPPDGPPSIGDHRGVRSDSRRFDGCAEG